MVGINFIYKNQETIIYYDQPTSVKNAFEEFSNRNQLNIDNLHFYHNNIKVNLNTDLFIEQQFDINNKTKIGNNDKQILEILVFDKDPFQNNLIDEKNEFLNNTEEAEIFKKLKTIEINFIYKKTNNIIKCSPKSLLKDICNQFSDSMFLE